MGLSEEYPKEKFRKWEDLLKMELPISTTWVNIYHGIKCLNCVTRRKVMFQWPITNLLRIVSILEVVFTKFLREDLTDYRK